MSTHVYSLSADFPDGFNQLNFTEEVADDENFSDNVKPLVSVVVIDDVITVTMSAQLQPIDSSRFTSIASSHDSRPSIWKTISTAFPNGLNMSRLSADLNTALGNIFNGILGYPSRDRVKLVFSSVPNTQQINIITTVIATHIPTVEQPRIQQVNLPIRNVQISNTYTLVSRFQLVPGGSVLDYIDLIAYTSKSSGRYQFKVVRADTKAVIGESDIFSNTTFQVCSIGAFTNVPTDYSILEIYVRRTGNDRVSTITVDQISFWCHVP